jgi:hypothetical protein
MTNWRLGALEEAKDHLAQSEWAFKEIVDGSENDFGPWWTGAAGLELALREARSVVRSEPGVESKLEIEPDEKH